MICNLLTKASTYVSRLEIMKCFVAPILSFLTRIWLYTLPYQVFEPHEIHIYIFCNLSA